MEEKVTHVCVDEKINSYKSRMSILDNQGFIESYDFSRGNLNQENRIGIITKVASICYQNPKAPGSINLFNRLAAESSGLPSSSFEFVPVLLSHVEILALNVLPEYLNIVKYGEWVNNGEYLLTNYRAIVYDYENHGVDVDLRLRYNTEEECEIIKEHFRVFLYNVDLPTRAQMVRHRINWQELSRRYVSGKKAPFSFYISPKMVDVNVDFRGSPLYTEEYIELGIELYNAALDRGIKPEEARRIIPQAMMTQIWGAYQPRQLESFYKLRLDTHAQKEIREVAETMVKL